MGMFCLDMLAIALELTRTRPAYEAIATKFFEHFVAISHAINGLGGGIGMWDPVDRFYYDVVRFDDGPAQHLKIRSFVGLIPLFASLAVDPGTLERLPQFRRRVQWYLRYRPVLAGNLCLMTHPGKRGRWLLALADRAKLEAVLTRVFDPAQFLSDYGLRSLSRGLADEPYICAGKRVGYEPAESTAKIYGGNSNWRGPIWFPVNYLMIQALLECHRYYGETLTIELPRGGARRVTLEEGAAEIALRLIRIFARDSNGRRPANGDCALLQSDPYWRDCIPFYEYFHGEHGAGLGASHQTGWTALVAELLQWKQTWPVAPAHSDGTQPDRSPTRAPAQVKAQMGP
jgi:hypothetical protein